MQEASYVSYENIDLLAQELKKLGYSERKVVLANEPYQYHQFQKNGISKWITAAHPRISYPLTTHAIRSISKNKTLSYEVARKIEIQIPETITVTSKENIGLANEMLSKHRQLIVKPESGSLSVGLAMNIQDKPTLQAAIQAVFKLKDSAIVQEQVHGDEIRIAVINGHYSGSVLRQTPQVTGDGTSTLAKLIKAENLTRSSIKNVAVAYPSLSGNIINKDHLTNNTVPQKGQTVELGRGTMICTGASIYNVTDLLHPSYQDIAERIARFIGAGFLAVDIMVQDYTKKASPGNYWLIEINSSPVLKLFYSCRDGQHLDIAPALAKMIDQSLRHLGR